MDKSLDLIKFDSIPAEEVEEDLKVSKVNALTTISHDNKLFCVCIMTEKTIYLFDPKCQNSTHFISKQLKEGDSNIYTVDGVLVADLLYRNMGIRFERHQRDLRAIHVNLEIRERLTNMTNQFKIEPCTLEILLKRKQKVLSYPQLIKKYLDRDINIEFSQEELRAFESLPNIGTVAREAIKRYVGPLRELAEKVLEKKESLIDITTKLFKKTVFVEDGLREEYERKEDSSIRGLGFLWDQKPKSVRQHSKQC